MEDGAEFTGRTVEEAIQTAERQLGVTRDTLTIDVVTAGRSGVFGIGAEPAKVRVTSQQAASAAASAPPPDVTTTEPKAAPAVQTDEYDEPVAGAPDRPAARSLEDGNLPEEAGQVLRQLLESMGIDAEVTVRSTDSPVMLGINGDNLGVLIGRRGDNLAALQFMVNLILSKNRRQWPRVVVDVENYRARREESLKSLADRIAYRVRRNGRPFTLEAMPASDRRIIHLTLRDRSDVETYSIGEGPARRVVIAPKRDARAPQRSGYSHSEY